MKPDGEMHAGAEEVELEPSDFFIDIATLIIEGRVPVLTEKGFGEGPHCRPVHGQNRHVCDTASPDCQQYEQLEKHMLLLWKNGIPMSVEVLLYPDCCKPVGTKVQVETSSVPETSSCILLEQWTLHMPQRRTPDALIVPKGLLQAVRSFLHFSQLSAWLSLGKGKIKTNIHYRVCVPGEAFSTKFERNPDIHKFPVANVGRSHAMKVTIKSLPRQGEFPKVPCLKHGVDLAQSPIASSFLESNSKGNENSGTGAVKQRLSLSARPQNFEGSHFPSSSSFDPPRDKYSKKSWLKCSDSNSKNQYEMPSPVTETSLGECLLDPPQSLLSYPKRYQSPSRCGSPSVEVPEHLMFGLGATAISTRAEALIPAYLHPTPKAVITQPSVSMRDRSRPQRRPVVERFLKKDIYGAASPSKPLNLDCDRLKQIDQTKKHLKDMLVTPNGMVEDGFTKNNITPHYPGKYPPKDLLDDGPLEKEEMKMVLDSLKHRYHPSKVALMSQFEESRPNHETPLISQSYLFNSVKCKKIPPESDCNKREAWKLKEESRDEQMEWTSSLSKDNQWFRDHVLPNGEKCNKLTMSLLEDSVSSPKTPVSSVEPRQSSKIPSSPYQNHSISPLANIENFKDQESPVKLTNAELSLKPCTISENIFNGKCTVTSPAVPEFIVDQRKNHNEKSFAEPSLPSKESGEATRELLLNNSQSINASQRILGRNFASLYFKMLKSNLNLPIQDDKSEEKPDKNGHLIPSAAEKLKFRRSLDSATSMVFHQNTGLPLTSSPAPIRKSGTCFDFDSSLTSVAAIKKALFEKDPELDEETKRLISSSAPASTTTSNLLGNFEESVLNGRLEPVSTVEGFTAEIGASGSFCPRHKTLPVTVFFYTLHDIHNKVTSPYLGHINLGRRGYNIPKKGTVQVTLFNPHRTVVKMFVVRYDLSDMPPCSQTFLRQRTLYMPTGSSEDDDEARKWLRYLIHLRFASSKSGKIYLHTDIRMIVFRKSDLDAATVHGQSPYELRSFTQGPKNPKFSPCK